MLLTQDAPPPPSTGLKTARWVGAWAPFPLDATTCKAAARVLGLGRVLIVRLVNGQLVRVRAR